MEDERMTDDIRHTLCHKSGQTKVQRWPNKVDLRAEWPLQGIQSEKVASGRCSPISTNHVALFGLSCTRFYPAPCFGHIPAKCNLFWPLPKKKERHKKQRKQRTSGRFFSPTNKFLVGNYGPRRAERWDDMPSMSSEVGEIR